jgi:hypothetical protein
MMEYAPSRSQLQNLANARSRPIIKQFKKVFFRCVLSDVNFTFQVSNLHFCSKMISNCTCAQNFDYVAASRPTELSKLFLLGPLTEVHIHAFPKERHAITEEYNRLKNTLSTNQQDVNTAVHTTEMPKYTADIITYIITKMTANTTAITTANMTTNMTANLTEHC